MVEPQGLHVGPLFRWVHSTDHGHCPTALHRVSFCRPAAIMAFHYAHSETLAEKQGCLSFNRLRGKITKPNLRVCFHTYRSKHDDSVLPSSGHGSSGTAENAPFSGCVPGLVFHREEEGRKRTCPLCPGQVNIHFSFCWWRDYSRRQSCGRCDLPVRIPGRQSDLPAPMRRLQARTLYQAGLYTLPSWSLLCSILKTPG